MKLKYLLKITKSNYNVLMFYQQFFNFFLQLSNKALLVFQLRVQAADLRILPVVDNHTSSK